MLLQIIHLIYLIHHPLIRRYFIMSEILQITQGDSLHQRKLNLLLLEEKICRCTFRQELQQNYKKNNKIAIGMSLKFIPSLCNDEKTNKLCSNILRDASFKLRDIMLERVSTKIVNLLSEKTNLVRTVK